MPATTPPDPVPVFLDLFTAQWSNPSTLLNRLPDISTGQPNRQRRDVEQIRISEGPGAPLEAGVGANGTAELRRDSAFVDIWTNKLIEDSASAEIGEALARKVRRQMRDEVHRILKENQTTGLPNALAYDMGAWIPLEDASDKPVWYRFRMVVRYSWISANV